VRGGFGSRARLAVVTHDLDVVDDDQAPRVARNTFLVDPEGRIARTWAKVKPEGHAAEVIAALDEARSGRQATAAR
jgi:peroxiredoxin